MDVLALLEDAPVPAFWSLPAHATGSAGAEAAQLADGLGLELQPVQRFLLELALAERADHRWAAFENCTVMPRQLGKTTVLQLAAMHDLFVRGVGRVVWTAHLRKTTLDTFGQMERWVAGNDWLSRRVLKVSHASGEESIALKSGARIDFMARTSGGGRGLDGDVVVLDEALELVPSMMGALIPILTTKANAQVRYGSSAGILKSDVLRAIRDRGRAGGDPSLAYAEWCAPTGGCAVERCTHQLDTAGCVLDDEGRWWSANPTRRVSVDYLRSERRALPPAQFAVERMGWWDDPPSAGAGVLPGWSELVDVAAKPTRPVFGVDVGEDRLVSIGCAWVRPDSAVQVMASQGATVDVGLSTAQAVERLAELSARWGGTVMLGGPAAGLEDDLRAAGVRVAMVTSAEFATACGQIADRVADVTLRHGNQAALNAAVQGARWRPVGTAGERAWQLKDSPGIGPLSAVTRAVAGLRRAAPSSGPVAITTSSDAFDVARMEF
jgi:hypothetical protein